MEKTEKLYRNLPETPGVYIMKDATGKILYVGKAGNLKRRVSSYFSRPHDSRIQALVSGIARIDYESTDTAIEALILESKLIKRFQPPFNVREKDDKSFLFVEITKEEFPRVLLARGKDRIRGSSARYFGPFTSASSIREALKIVRRIFPWSVHPPETIGKSKRPCFDYEIGLCPGTCVGKISRGEYLKNIQNVTHIFKGKKKLILRNLEKEMETASAALRFEIAEKLRRQIFNLKHIQDVALISDSEINIANKIDGKTFRIEGYDISNISGTSATGSMVVFSFLNGGWVPDKNEYRKFKIRTILGANDVGMMKEVLRRRFARSSPSRPATQGDGHPIAKGDIGWPLPDLVLVDGGKGQINAAKEILREFRLKIPVIGIAKGPKRKRNDVIGIIPNFVSRKTLVQVRDEAHRFAVQYHTALRSRSFLE